MNDGAIPQVRPTHHVVLYSPGPHWSAGRGLFEQPLQGHARFNAELVAAGLLTISGPFLDRDSGISVLRVADGEEARRIVADDPAVRDGIFVADVVPFFSAFVARGDDEAAAPPPEAPA